MLAAGGADMDLPYLTVKRVVNTPDLHVAVVNLMSDRTDSPLLLIVGCEKSKDNCIGLAAGHTYNWQPLAQGDPEGSPSPNRRSIRIVGQSAATVYATSGK